MAFLFSVAVAGCGARSRPATTHPSPRVSIAELKTDCDRGRWSACEELATCYLVGSCPGNGPREVDVDRRLAASYVARACDLGHLDGCAGVGALHLSGNGLVRDLRAGFEILVTTCERGSANGCGLLGYAYENGWGTDIDLDKARVAYDKQCAMDATGCQGISEPCSVNVSGCEARDEVRSRPTADYRWWHAGNNRTCPIHGVAMLEDRVPLGYGLGTGFEHSLDEKEGAPFANTYVSAGTCMSPVDRPKAAWVYYCPVCRRRKDALAWHPPNEPLVPTRQRTGSAGTPDDR